MSRPITSKSKKNRQRRDEYAQDKALDKLAAFEEFNRSFPEGLKKALLNGLTVEEMRKTMAPLLEARKLTIALTSEDEGRALTAITDAQNRIEGKPKERTEHTHKFAQTKDEELDAILASKLEDAASSDAADDQAH